MGGVIAKSAFDRGVEPRVLAEWRVLFAFAAFTLIVAAWRPRELRIRGDDLLTFAAFGVFGMGAVQWLYYEAIQRIPIAVALVVEFTAVILVLLYFRLRGRKVGPALWYAGILSLVGCLRRRAARGEYRRRAHRRARRGPLHLVLRARRASGRALLRMDDGRVRL